MLNIINSKFITNAKTIEDKTKQNNKILIQIQNENEDEDLHYVEGFSKWKKLANRPSRPQQHQHDLRQFLV